ncbi:hypothetical protein AUC68_07145 [Methyloceanibacter methanicus]|uniref:Uncharacterized protein n=2 Tax=Methyloceanibacter methanicus TaxID=1774968 RepID=A0A1E3W1C1_9HYPH|nr:hypothetical protein AUC68_07145 [Methyloceanibacter methanicus]
MPSFTPVTRGGQQAPAQAQPAAPRPRRQPSALSRSLLPIPPSHPIVLASQPQPARPQPAQPQAAQTQAAQPQAYSGGHDFQQPPQHPQAYATPAAPQAGAPSRELPDFGAVDPGFPDSIFGDMKLGAGLEDHAAPAADELAADAGFPEEDASFPEPAAPAAAYQAAPASYQPDAYAPQQPEAFAAHQPEAFAPHQPEAYAPQQPEAYAGQPMPGTDDPAMYAQQPHQQGAPYGHVPPADPSRQLQTLDPNYGQAPQIPLGDPRAGMQPAAQGFFDAGGDADFMDAGVDASEGGLKSKVMGTLKGRSTVMVASALLGAIALGGALAYAYKQSGGGIGSGDAPIVTADASPVKAAPDSPGGKEFPHKNKLIYDRLTNGGTPESERLVPRQEDVAVPALPPATATAGLPGSVARRRRRRGWRAA